MTTPHDVFKALAPIDWNDIDQDDLRSLLADTFVDAQCLIDSIPIPSNASSNSNNNNRTGRPRSATDPASPQGAGRAKGKGSQPPSDRAELLRREWKGVQVNPRDNPLGVTVYRMAAKDRRGAWFARRSVHAGVSFERWRRGMEAEFAESLKVQGGPGEGRIRGIGADRRVVQIDVGGCGRVEVYQLSAQFPGPTTPRDFVTLLLSTDSTIDPASAKDSPKTKHYMLVSRPCIHPECPQRGGYIRGQYESVEYIREIKVEKPLRRTHSSIDFGNEEVAAAARQKTAQKMNKEAMARSARNAAMSSSVSDTEEGEGRKRGRTIHFAGESENEEDDDDQYETLVEWLMVTRSDPGGSVPRFMVEKGTPAGIASDADKFLKWVSSRKADDSKEPGQVTTGSQKEAPATESNSPENRPTTTADPTPNILGENVTQSAPMSRQWEEQEEVRPSGLYGMIAGALGAVASSLPNPFPLGSSKGGDTDSDLDSTNDIDAYGDDDEDNASSIHSFHSLDSDHEADSKLTNTESNIAASLSASKEGLGDSQSMRSSVGSAALQAELAGSGKSAALAQHEKELRKLEERHRKLMEKAARAQEKANAKKEKEKEKERQKAKKAKANNKGKSKNSSNDDVRTPGEADGEKEQGEKEEATAAADNDVDEALRGADSSNDVAMAKLREKHAREVARQEEKYQRELQRLEARRASEQRKAEERRRKTERADLAAELERVRAERDVARKQADVLREQIGELQAQNTLLVARLGRMQGLDSGNGTAPASGEVGAFLQELKRTDSFRDSLAATGGSGSGSSGKSPGRERNTSNGSLAA